MSCTRRAFLHAGAALGAALPLTPLFAQTRPELLPASQRQRVVVVGGGWGGLAAARYLRQQAPELEVVLLEKNASFWSCPLSHKWLAGLVDTSRLVHDYGAAAKAFGYTFVQAEVEAIEPERRRIVTPQGNLGYDWLVLAVGIGYDYGAWFGDDQRAAAQARAQYPGAFIPGTEFQALKRKLEDFRGGDLVMTVPPAPYRCPPAPYERAAVIGWWLKRHNIPGRLIVLDPNPAMPAFSRLFSDQFKAQISYMPHSRVTSVDPFQRRIVTEFDDLTFSDALLAPPQQAGLLAWQAGLIGRESDGKPTGWADVDPLSLQARGDARIFLVGDMIGKVSPLFGHYPKSGHLAARLGAIAAGQIAARAQGREAPLALPDSTCYVMASLEPQELLRLDAQYRVRGDGLIAQTVKQTYDPNPRGEDEQWAAGMFRELLASS
ncbi:MAG: NAD(P)/FAD-dependent oxidoreductase [Betaproteobacteria bacterium]|nr:NAD(P)/FAD-dependent oxidoreductase [Betaproteobacteria bacterium]